MGRRAGECLHVGDGVSRGLPDSLDHGSLLGLSISGTLLSEEVVLSAHMLGQNGKISNLEVQVDPIGP